MCGGALLLHHVNYANKAHTRAIVLLRSNTQELKHPVSFRKGFIPTTMFRVQSFINGNLGNRKDLPEAHMQAI